MQFSECPIQKSEFKVPGNMDKWTFLPFYQSFLEDQGVAGLLLTICH